MEVVDSLVRVIYTLKDTCVGNKNVGMSCCGNEKGMSCQTLLMHNDFVWCFGVTNDVGFLVKSFSFNQFLIQICVYHLPKPFT